MWPFFFFFFFANGCDIVLVSSPSSRSIISGKYFSPHSSIEEDIPTLLIHLDDLRQWQIIPSVAPYYGDYFVYSFGVSSLFPISSSPTSLLGTKSNNEDPTKLIQDIFTSPFTKSTPYTSLVTSSAIALGSEFTRQIYDKNQILFQRQLRPLDSPPQRQSWQGKEHRSCLSTISIGVSSIPKAGKGVFVKKAMKKGELITVSPVFVLPRHEVIQTITRSLLMNYCLISSDEEGESDVALLPATQMAMMNHGGLTHSNVMISWTQATVTAAEGFLSWSPKALEDEYNPPLELAYIATRDLSAGEELLIDYGETWEGQWTEYLTDLERWVAQGDHSEGQEIANKPQFRSFLSAPKDLFPSQWRWNKTDTERTIPCLGSTPCLSRDVLRVQQADYDQTIERILSLFKEEHTRHELLVTVDST
jgi:hypothetical protein